MKYHTSTTPFNCGIDLHVRQMYACVMDRQGKKLIHTTSKQRLRLLSQAGRAVSSRPDSHLRVHVRLAWLADACEAAGLKFVLAHALYVRAIHGGKNKNDRVDSEKLNHLLRSNLISPAYVYPAQRRHCATAIQ